MAAPVISIMLRSRPDKAVSIKQRHAEVMAGMNKIGPPLGFAGLEPPPTPDCGGNLNASFSVKLPIRGLKFMGSYEFRGERHIYRDHGAFDDLMDFWFRTSNKAVDYHAILHQHLPRVAEAFEGYKAFVSYGPYGYYYSIGGPDNGCDAQGYAIEINPIYNRLRQDKTINIDGRNNIYTLYPAQHWDAQLCERALGYGRDEVIRRLEGKVPKAERLMDGVYLILNDNPALTYDEFVAMNETIKPMLGLL
jgi:hypothetical protein